MDDLPTVDRSQPSPIARLFTAYAALQVLLALAALVRNKVTAVSLGPTGYGLFAQLMNVKGLLVAAAALGMGVALRRNLAVTDDHHPPGYSRDRLHADTIVSALLSYDCDGGGHQRQVPATGPHFRRLPR